MGHGEAGVRAGTVELCWRQRRFTRSGSWNRVTIIDALWFIIPSLESAQMLQAPVRSRKRDGFMP